MSSRHAVPGVLLLAIAGLSAASPDGRDGAAAAAAAARFAPDVQWNAGSTRRLDFTCRGRTEFALLGRARATGHAASATRPSVERGVVVAVFAAGLTRPPKLLHVGELSPEAASLTVESLDRPSAGWRETLGAVPSGWRRSRSCKGLALGDGATDSFHLYWHARLEGLAYWRL